MEKLIPILVVLGVFLFIFSHRLFGKGGQDPSSQGVNNKNGTWRCH